MRNSEETNGKSQCISSENNENKSSQLRPNSLSIAPSNNNNSNGTYPICSTSSLFKEFLSPFGNVILASPNIIDLLSPRTILNPNNLTNEQLQVDKIFTEKYKEIKAQNLKEEKIFSTSCNESTILVVSQNALDQLSGAIAVTNQSIKSIVDENNLMSLATSNLSNLSNACQHNHNSNHHINQQQNDEQNYIQNAPSSTSSVEIPTSSNCSENDKLKIKIDKKRARNRDAARKCRERKLQLMKKLEKEVQVLTQQKGNLENKAQNQKKQIENLKAVIVQHLKNGCKM